MKPVKEKEESSPRSEEAILKSMTRLLVKARSFSVYTLTKNIRKLLADYFICDHILLFIGMDHGTSLIESADLAGADDRSGELTFPVSKNLFPVLTALKKRPYASGELPPGQSVQEHNFLSRFIQKEKIHILPIRASTDTLGIIVFHGLAYSPGITPAVLSTLNALIARCILAQKRKLLNAMEIDLFHDIQNFSPYGIFVLKPDHNNMDFAIIRANKSAFAMHGYLNEELEGSSFSRLQNFLEWLGTRGKINSLLNKQIQVFDCQQKRRDGSFFRAELNIRRISIRGEAYILLSCSDLSRRNAGMLPYGLEEAKYALSTQASNDGYWVWNLQTKVVHYSPRWSGMLGYEACEIQGDFDYWDSLTHYEDLPNVRAALAKHLQNESESFEIEYRIRHRDGTWRWMLCRGSTIHDQNQHTTHIAGIQVDITKQKQAELSLIYGSSHDSITGLPNRMLFSERLRTYIDTMKDDGQAQFAVFCVNIDRFKPIRDTYGQSGGEALLKEIALRLSRCIQSEDILARIGGEEFAIASFGIHTVSAAVELTYQILECTAAPVDMQRDSFHPSVSIGLTISNAQHPQSEEVLLRDAETAMYQARAVGGACYAVFNEAMHQQNISILRIEEDLKHAMENSEFELFFQPLLSLHSHTIRGFEALNRWRHPARGIISPVEYIPIAEKMGLILDIGKWTLDQTCAQLAKWRALGHGDVCIAINLSGRQMDSEDLPGLVKDAVEKQGICPEMLEIEITESTAMRDFEKTIRILGQLREIGVRVSIDDFGTGYSSLSYLKHFPINTLKIDQSFIRDIPKDPKNISIVNAIIALATSLQLEVIAEGVETIEQYTFLEKTGCHYIQGYLLGRPVDVETATKLLIEGIALPS
ncbi:MAG: EAL domain-containing protein [Spirochaetota bacterium]|nr:EAL domain-containing protein [Spirochaetota bacterium]